MHKQLAIRLLGAPEIRLDDQPLTAPVAAKAQALLYYLALTGRAHTRSALAGLLWGDMPEEMARTNLRKALADLRPVANGYLLSDNQMIGLKQEPALWVDVEIFAGALKSPERQTRQQALDLYRGDLLEGFYVRNAPDFENWLVSERSHYRQKVVQALHDLAADYAQQGALSEAIGALRRLLTLEPWDETSQRTLMVWLAQSGQRSAALTQFEACRRALEAELAVEPDEETVALYEQIRAGKLDKVAGWQGDKVTSDKVTSDKVSEDHLVTPSPLHLVIPTPHHNLPEPTTPLVGRQAELTQIQSLLADPACRLLTLTGPGGMGKTRLALAAARTCVAPSGHPGTGNAQAMPLATRNSQFEDGVYFVALAAVTSPAYIVPTIADALGLRFAGTLDVQTQLINYLRQKKLLLVLDNLEQLMSEAAADDMAAPAEASAALLLELLQRAPGLKLLATSREPLNLVGEWLLDLAGLSTPTGEGAAQQGASFLADSAPGQSADFDAVALFLQCARRLKANFMPNAQELAAVVRICRLVDGLPLGIELAASWMRALSCGEIADEIEHNLAFLTTNQRGVPERHRSMQAVFDYSWHLLAEEEQRALAGLAVFRGGFTRQAASAVAGATLPQLSILITKSLVQRIGEQRYDLHELVRQFAAARLQSMVDEQASSQRRHAEYFGYWVASRGVALMSSQQPAVVAEFLTEIGNIRLALDEMIAQQRAAPLRAIGWILWHFFEVVYYFQEGETTFQRVQVMLQSLNTPDTSHAPTPHAAMHQVALINMSALRAYFSFRRGNLHEALPQLAAAVSQIQQHNEPQLLAFLHLMYGMACWAAGEFAEAIANQHQANALSSTHGPEWVHATSPIFLGTALHEVGKFDEAYETLRLALQAARKLGDPRAITFCISMLSRTAQTLGRSEEVIDLLQAGRELAQQSGDRFNIAFACEYLALALFAKGAANQAQQLLTESGNSYRQLGDRWNLARVLNYLGGIALQQNHLDEAQSSFAEAVGAAHEANVLPQLLDALLGLATIRGQRDDPGIALAVATIIEQHSAASQEARQRAEQLATALVPTLPMEQVAIDRTRFQGQPLEAVVAEVLRQL